MAIGMASTTAGILPLLLLVFLGLSGASASTLTATDAITIPIAQDVGHEEGGSLGASTGEHGHGHGRRLQMDDQMCSNGLPGYEAADVCCPLSCGTCGGVGCSQLGDGCCTSDVKDSGDLCSVTMAAPCNIDGDIEDGQSCSNGLPGYEAADVCCPLSCGTCGGVGCSQLGDGCCTSDVKDSGDLCSVTMAAPCNIDGDVDDDQSCSNGLPGYEAADVCCPLSCGTCGGVGCSQLGDGCCTSDVKDSGDLCSVTMAAPCNIDGDIDDETPICDFIGYPGYQGEGACCSLECGQCASGGCEDLPGGPAACCPAVIIEFGGLYCDGGVAAGTTGEAPCYVNEQFNDGDDDSEDAAPVCSNGLAGYEKSGVCCPAFCGQCGGEGCSQLIGGAEWCCTTNVMAAGESCSEKGAAPCVVS